MIFKKMSYRIPCISGHYPDHCLYFDIETTGLQRQNALIYLIGCAYQQPDGNFCIQQWFAENPDEEAQILQEFCKTAVSFSILGHFSGTTFDLPFLSHRCELYQIDNPCSDMESRDLYIRYRPLKKLLNLPGLKQQNLEEFLNLSRRDTYSGKDCISLYRNLIKYRDIRFADPLLLHNLEDIQGLLRLESLQAYLGPQEGHYVLNDVELSAEQFHAILLLDAAVPRSISISNQKAGFSLYMSERTAKLSILLVDGLLKNYYADYKNYYYLPDENTAIHKSIGSFVDRKCRRQATKHTCYTRFMPGPDFFSDKQQTEHYIRKNLPILLTLL